MRAQFLAGLRTLLVLTLLCGVAYPLVVTGVAQVAFGDKADGSLVVRDGTIVGSKLLGQSFAGEAYFHTRPSAAGPAASGSPTEEGGPADPNDLSLVASGASNLGPTNPDLLSTVEDRVTAYRAQNGLDDTQLVPVDAVTASGSGLDPHISVANALLQAPRVAEARRMTEDEVVDLVEQHTIGRSLGVLGEAGVDVLALNLHLDALD